MISPQVDRRLLRGVRFANVKSGLSTDIKNSCQGTRDFEMTTTRVRPRGGRLAIRRRTLVATASHERLMHPSEEAALHAEEEGCYLPEVCAKISEAARRATATTLHAVSAAGTVSEAAHETAATAAHVVLANSVSEWLHPSEEGCHVPEVFAKISERVTFAARRATDTVSEAAHDTTATAVLWAHETTANAVSAAVTPPASCVQRSCVKRGMTFTRNGGSASLGKSSRDLSRLFGLSEKGCKQAWSPGGDIDKRRRSYTYAEAEASAISYEKVTNALGGQVAIDELKGSRDSFSLKATRELYRADVERLRKNFKTAYRGLLRPYGEW